LQPELVHDPACVDLLLLVLPLDDHKDELCLVPNEPRPDLDVLVLAAAQPNTATSSSASPLRVLLGGIPGSEEVHVVLNALVQK